MKTLVSAAAMALMTTPAFAHISVFDHEHPHGISWLPDLAVLFIVAVLVGAVGVVLFAISKRGGK